MPIQAVPNYTPPPTPPIQRGDRATFSDRVDQTITYLVGAPGEVKAMADVTYNNAVIAEASATTAVSAKDTAVASAATAVGTVPVTSLTPPLNPAPNAVWIHENTAREYTYLATASGYRWVETRASLVFQRPLAEDITAQINTRVALSGARQNVAFAGPGSVLAVGRNSNNAGAEYQGLQIGGGDPTYGADGVVMGNDGHASWMRFQPSKNESPLEVLLYATSAQGIATANTGTNIVTRISGTMFNAAWIGKKFYFGEAAYRVATVPDGNSMTVTTLAGAAVSFGSTFNETYHVSYIKGSGTANISSSFVTRVSGDPFLPFFALASFVFKLNGVQRTVIANPNSSSYTLSTQPGNATNVPYTFELDINDQITTLRLQKLIGSDEENLSLYSRYDGYWIASQFAGSGKYRPVILSTGQIAGAEARQVNMYANGDITLGGPYGADSLRLLARAAGTVANRMEIAPATTGFKAALRARGTDANVGMGFDVQGTGEYLFTGGSFARALMKVNGSATANSYLTMGANVGFASASVESSLTDADLRILPKGTGKVMFGTNSTAAATPASFVANRMIAIKDGTGTVYYVPCMAATW